jgi:hypothetical protein
MNNQNNEWTPPLSPSLEFTYPEPSPPGSSRMTKLFNGLRHAGFLPAFSADASGNLTLECHVCASGARAEKGIYIIRVPRDEVTETTKLEILEHLAEQFDVPEKWVI